MEHLKELRTERGLLQKDIATFLGIDRTTYVKYEKGDNEPSNEILIKLAKFFSVSVDYLLGISNVKSATTVPAPKESEIETLFNKLNSLGKEKATEYISDLLDNPKYTSEDIAGDTASA